MATITAASYAGDEGGIMCRLEIPHNEKAVHVLHHLPALRSKIVARPGNYSLPKTPREAPQARRFISLAPIPQADTALTERGSGRYAKISPQRVKL